MGSNLAGRSWAALAVTAAAWLAIAPEARGQCASSFAAAVNYGAGDGPQSVAIGDLNGDGKPDLVVSNYGAYPNWSGSVSVLLGNANGTFAPAVNYNAGSGSDSVAIGDLNGDGNLDVAVANYESNNVSVLLGTGNPNPNMFAAAVNYPAGPHPVSLAIGDLNGDGKPDLVVVIPGTIGSGGYDYGDALVLINTGNPNPNMFAGAVGYGTGPLSGSVAIGDLNGDGRPDLVVANSSWWDNEDAYSGSVSVLLGTGNLNPNMFASQDIYEMPSWEDEAYAVAIGDLNGDGRPDLAVALHNEGVAGMLLNNGPGFNPAVYISGSMPGGARSVAIGDLNGDGRADLVFGYDSTGYVSVRLGNGDGTFAARADYGTTGPVGQQFVAIGDLNGDGAPDLAVANTHNYLPVLLNSGVSIVVAQQPVNQTITEGQNAVFSVTATGAQSFRWRRNGTFLTNGGRFSGVTTSTLTITGALPADAGLYDVQMAAACNAGIRSQPAALSVGSIPPHCSSSFAAAANYPTGASPVAIAAGDLNGDGIPDLATANLYNNTVSIFIGSGNGTYQPAATYPVVGGPISIAISDLDLDGKLDLVTANYSTNRIAILTGNGNGGFSSPIYVDVGTGPYSVAVGDLDANGLADIVTANSGSNNVSIVKYLGGRAWGLYGVWPTGADPHGVAIGDVDGDGRPDILTANNGGNNVSVLRGAGNGIFYAAVNYACGLNPQTMALADLNGDGTLDLVTGNYGGNNISVLLNNSAGGFSNPVTYPVGTNPWTVVIGDMNGDGRPDIAAANAGGANVSVLSGNGDGTFGAAVTYATDSSSTSLAIGDLNGDGRSDLAVANYAGGDVSILLNNSPSVGFSTQPANQSIAAGQNAIFTAAVSGTGPFTYRWRRNGTPLTNGGHYSGVTATTLSVTNATTAEIGSYDLQVTGGCNPAAVNYSRSAALSVAGCKGDFNNDGVFNTLDIQNIVNALLAGQSCPF